MFRVEAMGHGEAQCSEKDPTVLLMIHHQIESRAHLSYITILIEERLAVFRVRGHIPVGRVSGGYLSEEEYRPVVSAPERMNVDWSQCVEVTS